MKKIMLLLIVVLILISCGKNAVNVESYDVTLNLNFDSLLDNNVLPDSLFVEFLESGSSKTFSFTNLTDKTELIFSDLGYSNSNVRINTTLHYNDRMDETYSKFDIYEEDIVIGNLTAYFKYDRVILKLDTNEKEYDNVDDFLSTDVLDHFYKKVEIENIEVISQEFLQTPMAFFAHHDIYWDELDENKIPLIPYYFGSYYNPVSTCNNAFGCYEEYLDTNDEMYLDWFYRNADWLISYRDSSSYLRYEFNWYHDIQYLNEGWISAMAQGEALAVMCMAFHVSGDEKYLSAAHDFYRTMHVNNEELWCVGIDQEDYLWYEEYPSPDFCHVLNGKLFGMWGLWTYFSLTDDDGALSLMKGALASILGNYPIWNYEGENASVYCTHRDVPTIYHTTHIQELETFRDLFNLPELNEVITVFREY